MEICAEFCPILAQLESPAIVNKLKKGN